MTYRIAIAIAALLLVPACYDSHTVCDEPEHAGDEACTSGFCPGGEPTYYARAEVVDETLTSAVERGDGLEPMEMLCEPTVECPAGLARIVSPDGAMFCVPLPPLCEPGTSPSWTDGGWRCDPPCAWQVHYGYIFGGQVVCAGELPTCRDDQVPTFDVVEERWFCRPPCDATTYDPVYTDDGTMVCVPC